jgi:hypothetical protein
VVDSWQGVVLQLGGWAWGYKLLTVKNKLAIKILKKPWTWTDSLDKRPKRKKMDMRLCTWNVRSMYRAGSLRVVAEEISKYKLDLVGVQEVRRDGHGTEPAGEYIFFYGKWNENHELVTGSFIHKRIMSAIKRMEFVSDMSYIILRVRWCNIIVLNVHATTEDKIDDIKDSFYEEVEQVHFINPRSSI